MTSSLEQKKAFVVPFMQAYSFAYITLLSAEYNPLYPWKQYDYTALKNDIKRYRRVKKFSSRFEGKQKLAGT